MTSPIEDPGNRTAFEPSPVAGIDAQENPVAEPSAADSDLWAMMADIGQRLQMSSASIKAAITSLLDTTIIWDRSAQHEFMVSINQSVDRSIPLIVAMTLAMKSEGGTLGWVIEQSSIQEILARVADNLAREGLVVPITLSLPDEGKPALVDYDYLRIALRMLLEALLSANMAPLDNLRLSAVEDISQWRVHVEGDFSGQASQLIAWLGAEPEKRRRFPSGINSEIMLKAFTAIRLLNQQKIELVTPAGIPMPTSFTLVIPATGN